MNIARNVVVDLDNDNTEKIKTKLVNNSQVGTNIIVTDATSSQITSTFKLETDENILFKA